MECYTNPSSLGKRGHCEAVSSYRTQRTYNLFISIALAIITISILVLLFVNITKLSTSNGNEQLKRIASNGILVCLVCLGFIGAIDTVYAMLMSIIFGMG